MNETLTGMGQRIFFTPKKERADTGGAGKSGRCQLPDHLDCGAWEKSSPARKYCETQSGTWSFNGLFADWKTQSNRSILTKRQIIRS